MRTSSDFFNLFVGTRAGSVHGPLEICTRFIACILVGMGGERETMVVAGGAAATEPKLEAVEVEVDDWCGEERQKLAHDEAADDGDTERATKFGAGAVAERERKRAEQRSHGGHEDGPEAEQEGFVNGFNWGETFQRFRLNSEINHKDR